MKDPRELDFGETPWDDLPREELLRIVQRQFAALQEAQGLIRVSRMAAHPFWQPSGSGGKVLAMVEACTRDVEATQEGRERVYRQFFRYAVDLLFADVPHVGARWMICDGCKLMMARRLDGSTPECVDCGSGGHQLRPITWADLRPQPSR